MMATNTKKDKLTLAEAITIINNASAEDKIEVTYATHFYYIIKIDDTNYIIYIPDDKKENINFDWIKNRLQLNTSDTYNFTVVSKSPKTLLGVEFDNYHKWYGLNINVDILYDMVDTPNKIELDDKKLRNMLTKARFTGRLYEIFGGYGYTINNNNIIWYIPDDCHIDNDSLYYIMESAHGGDERNILDNLDRDQIDRNILNDEITLNIHVVSNKKVFDTDFIVLIADAIESQHIYAYIHNNIANNTVC